MNKLIRQQLEKLNLPNKPEYDESTTHLVFLKQNSETVQENSSFVINGVYKIVIANYIVNPPPDFTLDTDWNTGRHIADTTLLIQITQLAGKMLRFTGRGYNFNTDTTNDNFYDQMWIPAKSIISYERIE